MVRNNFKVFSESGGNKTLFPGVIQNESLCRATAQESVLQIISVFKFLGPHGNCFHQACVNGHKV